MVSGAWTNEDKREMIGPRTEENWIILKHLVWAAWIEEGRSEMIGQWIEEDKIIKNNTWFRELGLKRNEMR